ncbi:hypothetical protein AB0B25_20735 [Nocardia sp. NPDC049190]|uniref:hypothetical protein n=1 Tax=Nocardia sp. NPDC049190 TaxID=3155650 RepID=UPI0033DF1319
MPILWGFAALVGGAILLLIVLALTHMGSTDRPADTAVVPSTLAPAQPKSCFPFNC